MAVTETDVRNAAPANAPEEVIKWITKVTKIAKSEKVEFSDGSQTEWDRLTSMMMETGILIRLNPEKRPNRFLTRPLPSDVTRVESHTSICCEKEGDAGPTNRWVTPAEMKETLTGSKDVFQDAVKGRTMYVVPFSVGPLGGPTSQLGIELTDSPYVACNMRIMTRMSAGALDLIREDKPWVPAAHSVGTPLELSQKDVVWPCNDEKYITHFPGTGKIWSYGSGYGGNALLGKKRYMLRIASTMGQRDGWVAEHMLILRLADEKTGRQYHVTAVLPSACGKANLAMLQPTIKGYKVETVGDDIAQMRPGLDGRLCAINPKAGFFGVALGASHKTNPMAIEAMKENTTFTNVALIGDGDVWWEGCNTEAPEHLIDRKGQDWTPASDERATHLNSRFTAPAKQCPIICPDWGTPQGVPIDAVFFSGRRTTNIPLVAEQYTPAHGAFIGSSMSSEVAVATTDIKAGSLRHDPFAMLPFCGYSMTDYWGYWLEMQQKLGGKFPCVYQVNQFRKDEDGDFLQSGYGENSRVLDWVVKRVSSRANAIEGPTGLCPKFENFNTEGISLDRTTWDKLFAIDPKALLEEAKDTGIYLAKFGDKLPQALKDELQA